MFRVFLLAVLVTGSLAGRSPNADYIDEVFKTPSGARYSSDIIEDAKLDVPGLVRKYGYPIETHGVITEDGYALTMHRIPHGRDRHNRPDSRKPVVFLMHGALSSSADYLLLGPGNAIGYLLAEAGYDVWMGNARGNYYSRRHRTLNPDSRLSQAFWKFSWDEMGNYDLPAFVDYIIRVTNQPKIHYLGHSQGNNAFLVLNSLRPEYNAKFISFQSLAPAVFWSHNTHPIFSNLAHMESVLEPAAYAMGIGEVFANREFVTWFGTRYCVEGSLFQPLCTHISSYLMSQQFNQTILPLVLGHAPAGASVRQFAHFGQNIKNDAFRRYSHGLVGNLRIYGRRTPPDYDLSKVTTPTYIYYGLSDVNCHPEDVKQLVDKTRILVEAYVVGSEYFNHFDFIWGSNVKSLLYDRVILNMKKAEREFL